MRVLLALADKWLPEFSITKRVDITTHVDDGMVVDITGHAILRSHAIVIDMTELNQQQLHAIRNIALELENKRDQEQGIVNAN